MWNCLWICILKKIYRILVVKVYTVDKAAMPSYHMFRTFCDLDFKTTQGVFSFSFKKDRRSEPRDSIKVQRSVSSYLVELTGPDPALTPTNPLYNKVIVVAMLHRRRINYEALARVLLDLYIDQFPNKA